MRRDSCFVHVYIKRELLYGVGAPDSFEVVDEVLWVLVVGVDELHGQLLPSVGKTTEIPIVAKGGVFGEGLAVLALVATRVVQLLDLVVAFLALAVVLVTGDVRVLVEVGPPSVLLVVVVETNLALVLFCLRCKLPLRGQSLVLKVLMSKRKNSP